MERAMNTSTVQTNGKHTVSQPSAGAPGDGQSRAGRVRLGVVENEFASVTVSLDTEGHSPRLHVRDNETGDDVLLSAIELASLCLATGDDRAGWLKVGRYGDQGDGGAPGQGGAPGSSAAGGRPSR